ncbi:hypothetical protein RB195_005747 [Necator americanus]|uniref:Zinc metalloproteinase n=1 Tax=Necator americanus TaxID=51031 RepID=A0ABR1BPD8_NECAM
MEWQTNDTIVGEDSFDNRLQHQEQRRNSSALWLQGVNFYFNSRFTKRLRDLFVTAANAWMKDTCIYFTNTRNAKDRIYVVETEHGCSSTVGRRGGTQFITIDRNCAHLGGFAHEIGHALGFEHTHRRHDRDDYIAVNWINVGKQFEDRYPDLARSSFKNNYIKTYQKQFEKLPASESVDYGFPYDYGSIMHYPSPSDNPIMIPKDINYRRTMGSPFISFTDLSAINELYNCKDRCKFVESAVCMRGGFPHPRNCSRCLCPSGYGGRFCDERPDKCGSELEASSDWKEFAYKTNKQKRDLKNGYHVCTYWITAPKDAMIEISIANIDGSTSEGCIKAGVEIKTNEDQTLTGYRFCDREDRRTNLTSYTNIVPIIYYDSESQYAFISTSLKYRYVKPMPATLLERFKIWIKNIFKRKKQ